MKAESIKNITDRESLHDLYSSLFLNRDVFLKTDGINIKVNFIKFDQGKIYLDIPSENYEFRRTAIYTRNMDEVAYSHIIPSGMEDNYYIFETEGSQVFFAPRRENRVQMDISSGKKAVISQIVSAFVIRESLMQNQSRVNWIRQEINSRIPAMFDKAELFFLGDRLSDIRMSRMMEDREPFFIPDIYSATKEADQHELDFYLREIYYHDPSLQRNNLVSEITVPLLYRMMLPFGYIQVNSSGPLDEDKFFTIKRLAMAYSDSLSGDQQIFHPSDDTISISDLSMNGLGMIFREKSLARHFREESLVIFTAYMAENRHASILCRVANISLCGEVYRVGCTIENIDTEGESHYKNFISGQ